MEHFDAYWMIVQKMPLPFGVGWKQYEREHGDLRPWEDRQTVLYDRTERRVGQQARNMLARCFPQVAWLLVRDPQDMVWETEPVVEIQGRVRGTRMRIVVSWCDYKVEDGIKDRIEAEVGTRFVAHWCAAVYTAAPKFEDGPAPAGRSGLCTRPELAVGHALRRAAAVLVRDANAALLTGRPGPDAAGRKTVGGSPETPGGDHVSVRIR